MKNPPEQKYTSRRQVSTWPLRPHLVNVLLLVPTFGLCWFWYRAKRTRYFS